MDWPLASDFSSALQNPRFAFADRELKQSEIEKDKNNQPKARSGAFANVYKASFSGAKPPVAVRVFTSASPERRERYQAIADHLSSRRLDCLVNFSYRDDGIRAMNGRRYPLVTMDWVRGEQLFDWVQARCNNGDQRSLTRASEAWVDTIGELRKARIAHGDLQHANVLVNDKGKLKLVDYDCMCVPALVGRKNLEIGVDPYQHPNRNPETQLSLELDNFSALFILVALKAVAASPDLWRTYVERPQYDKMLFRREDLDSPNNSKLIQELKRSRDKEVQRLTNSLVELTQVSIDQIPRLDELLFTFSSVDSLLSQKDFDGALELLTRNKKQISDAPAALQTKIHNAQQRVWRRVELEQAITTGDEQALKRLYEPKLLDDYPRAQPAVAIAKLAPTVIPILERLEASRAAQEWREFLSEWNSHQAILTPRKSAQKFAALARTWAARTEAWDCVLALLSQSTPPNGKLSTAHATLLQLGGHPESMPYRAKIELALEREKSWVEFSRVPQEATATADIQFVKAWNEKAFAGWAPAEQQRPRLQQAQQRLGIIEQLSRLVSQKGELQLEEQLLAIADKISSDYRHPLEDRVQRARLRVSAIRNLHSALQDPISDCQVAEICRRIHQLGAHSYLTPAQTERASLSEKRAELIARLKLIPADYDIQQAPQWDATLLRVWNNNLLQECLDAKPWLISYQHALHRKTLLIKLQQGIKQGDKLLIAEVASHAELKGYPYPKEHARIVRQAQLEVKSIRELLFALKLDDAGKLLAAFDASVIRQHPRAFSAHREKLLEWIRRAVLPADKIGLKHPLARKGLVQEPDSPECYRICWDWPKPRFTDRCLVAICEKLPGADDAPQDVSAYLTLPIDRKSFEEGGGSRRFPIRHDWLGAYVCVWAIIDLGFAVLYSEPLVLGRLESGALKGTSRFGGIFG